MVTKKPAGPNTAKEIVVALQRQLDAMSEHRERALELIALWRSVAGDKRASGDTLLANRDPLDLAVIVYLWGQGEPQSQNEIFAAMQAKSLSDGRANLSRRLKRLRADGVLAKVRAGGRGVGERWVHRSRAR